MSKQSKAKEEQQYNPKPVFPMCSKCVHFKSETEERKTVFGMWIKEVNIRCGLGNFAVKKQGTCKIHQFKPNENS